MSNDSRMGSWGEALFHAPGMDSFWSATDSFVKQSAVNMYVGGFTGGAFGWATSEVIGGAIEGYYSTVLYRAVLNPELVSIQSNGAYSLAPGINVNGFYPTAGQASNFASKMYNRFPGEGPYTLTSTTVPAESLPAAIPVAGEGPAYFLPSSWMPLGPVNVFPWMPIP